MQFVIAGAGEVGLGIAKTLLSRGHQVVLIEKNPEVVRTLNDTLAANIIEGDLAFYSTLRKIDVTN
ncbi:MAG: NAD-binding protein, partial [bacterium]